MSDPIFPTVSSVLDRLLGNNTDEEIQKTPKAKEMVERHDNNVVV